MQTRGDFRPNNSPSIPLNFLETQRSSKFTQGLMNRHYMDSSINTSTLKKTKISLRMEKLKIEEQKVFTERDNFFRKK